MKIISCLTNSVKSGIIKLMDEQSPSTNRNFLIGVGIVAVLFVGYLLFSNMNKQAPSPQPATTPTTPESASPSGVISEVTVTLSEQKASGESGTATLMEVDGKVKVTLNLTGVPVGVAQPAHIHMGACPDVDEVKYPLTSVMDGMSETTLDVTLAQLKSELPLGINVHKSGPEVKVYVSCGDLKL